MENNKYYQIGQVCKITGLTHSTIRFWEEKIRDVRPSRSSGGHRYYSSAQLNLILYIKELLYEQKYTIEGAKARLAEEKLQSKSKNVQSRSTPEPVEKTTETDIEKMTLDTNHIKSELLAILKLLD